MGLATAAEPAAFEGIKKDVTQASGVNIHFTHAQPGELEMIRAAGFKTVRMDITWEATEKTRGVYDFQAYDHLMQSLEANGLKAVLILNYSNRLYENLRSVTTDEGRAAYARWAAAVVDHFRGKGIIWEIWNEPNIEGFWKPKPNADD
ncbi:MAG: cellulase family glycosylhydrolase [Verrucomicrobium sp.]